jgi:hypothetical protein
MPVAAAIGTTMPRFGIFISQNGVRVTRYSGRVDWSRQAGDPVARAGQQGAPPGIPPAEDRHPRRR